MRISDWSSDVCSSDLPVVPALHVSDRGGREVAGTDQRVRVAMLFQEGPPGRRGLGLIVIDAGRKIRIARLNRAVDQVASDDPAPDDAAPAAGDQRSEEHTSELQ